MNGWSARAPCAARRVTLSTLHISTLPASTEGVCPVIDSGSSAFSVTIMRGVLGSSAFHHTVAYQERFAAGDAYAFTMNIVFDFGNVLVEWNPVNCSVTLSRRGDCRSACRTSPALIEHQDWRDFDRGVLEADELAYRTGEPPGTRPVVAIRLHRTDSCMCCPCCRVRLVLLLRDRRRRCCQ